MTTHKIAKHQDSVPTHREETRTVGRILTPAVDIFESEDSLTLMADMPGIDKEGLEINLEKGVLTINGEMKMESRGKAIVREFTPANYYRQFKLSEHIDAEKTSAELNNGVLTLQIPKAESAKPKKIEIRH
ncbi:Hsp20/alpha crystallin family protein [uncultured Desulfuromusa sp.]|nr:Hsp20/alpha crystallin family protein [uncultured Desulfuromusa sp.]